MLPSTIALPTWLFVLLLAAAVWSIVMSVLYPGVRWYLRRRLNRAVDRLNSSLRIKIRPLQRTRREVMIEQLMFDQEILAQIEQQAKAETIPQEVLLQRVRSYAREIVPSFNAYVYYQIGYWLAKRVSRFIYRVRVAAANPRRLQKVDPESTVVFVMNHRSNMDYVLISYLASEQVTLSYAVGEWARIFPLESLIRAMGAFFVRRGSHNPLYRKVLERYVYLATQSGVCQAVFLEGGLSRDGALGPPKLGFLDYMLRHYDRLTDRNIVFIPIGINYDRVLEDENLLGWDNKATRLTRRQHFGRVWRFFRSNLFIGSRRRWQRFGYASVNFGVPVSMREYCERMGLNFNHLPKEQRIPAIETLAGDLMESLRFVMPILPVPLLCVVLEQACDTQLTSLEIFARCDKLIDAMLVRGAPMKADEKPRHRTLVASLEMLKERGIVTEVDDRYRVNPAQQGLLRYYANSIRHWWEEVPEKL